MEKKRVRIVTKILSIILAVLMLTTYVSVTAYADMYSPGEIIITDVTIREPEDELEKLILEYAEDLHPDLKVNSQNLSFDEETCTYKIIKEATWNEPFGCDMTFSFTKPFAGKENNAYALANALLVTTENFNDNFDTELNNYIKETYTNGKRIYVNAEDFLFAEDDPKQVISVDRLSELRVASAKYFTPDMDTSRWNIKKAEVKGRILEWEENDYKYQNILDYTNEIEISMYFDISHYENEEAEGPVEEENKYNIQEEYFTFFVIPAISNISKDETETICNKLLQKAGKYENTSNTAQGFKNLVKACVFFSGQSNLWDYENGMIRVGGADGYEGDIGERTNKLSSWKDILKLKKENRLGWSRAADYNCTLFVQACLYYHYGTDLFCSSSTVGSFTQDTGRHDGRYYVENILNKEKGAEYFYLSNTPAPGAVFSVGGYGCHVGIIDAVETDENGDTYITYSDANWIAPAKIDIRDKLTENEFYERFIGKTGHFVTFAAPKELN